MGKVFGLLLLAFFLETASAQTINLNAGASSFNVYQMGVASAVINGVRQSTNFYDKNPMYHSLDTNLDDMGPDVDQQQYNMDVLDGRSQSDIRMALLSLTRVYVRVRQAHPDMTQAEISALMNKLTNNAYADVIETIKFGGTLW